MVPLTTVPRIGEIKVEHELNEMKEMNFQFSAESKLKSLSLLYVATKMHSNFSLYLLYFAANFSYDFVQKRTDKWRRYGFSCHEK